jgi:MraZ protein
MRLLGEFQQKLDDKGRLVLPAAFRDDLAHTKLILALGDHGELGIWPEADFDRRAEQKAAKEYDSDADARAYRRFTSNAGDVRLDGQSRLAISESLRRKAGFEGAGSKDALVIGVGNRVEIWEKRRFELFQGDGTAAEHGDGAHA